MNDLLSFVPPDAFKVVLVLFLSFLLGLEHEEHRPQKGYAFGGVRTFPQLGLFGYILATLAASSVLLVAVGLAVAGVFLAVSYIHKLKIDPDAGITTEISGLGTVLLGALVQRDRLWLSAAVVVVALLLLELKSGLENLAKRIDSAEIITFTKFLLLCAVILPIVPNQPFTPFAINPFKTWLVVVAVSAISYASYVLQRLTKGKGGILLSALLGGAYSSTVTTVVLAKRAAKEGRPHLFAGATLLASGVFYLRLILLLAFFSIPLTRLLAPGFLILGVAATVAGWLWSRLPDVGNQKVEREWVSSNPLELRAAFTFALIFVAMLVATYLTVTYLGAGGVYTLGALMGLTDITPYVLGLAHGLDAPAALTVAAGGIIVSAASNNLVKGGYAYFFSDRKTGKQSLALLLVLTLASLAPLAFL
jgi:uncharacterized membrane protein (DUF4010 family)